MNRLITIVALIFLSTNECISQDHHFSNYEFAPLQVNPSLCGSFYGNARIGILYREQWSEFILSPFQSALCFADISLNGLREIDWISFGIQLIGDTAGDIGYQSNKVSPSLAYHLSLDKNFRNVVSFGIELGFAQHVVGNNSFQFGDELLGLASSSSDRNFLTDFSENNRSLNLGLTYQNKNKSNTATVAGLGMQYILTPSFGNNRIEPRYNIHFSQKHQSKKFNSIKYAVYSSFQSQASNINLQFFYGFKLNEESDFLFNPGIGYRVKDALQLLLEIEYKLWSIYLGYDITLSSARTYNNGKGALELGVNKIIYNHKKPETTPILLCPRL